MKEKSTANQEQTARRIIERLKMFNRKERDYLMKFALCEEPAAPRISDSLWKLISNGGTRPDPRRMFIGMDYHLNWVYAALSSLEIEDERLHEGQQNAWHEKIGVAASGDPEPPIRGNQEDVDLLVAWFDKRWNKPLRLILVEAKLDGSWDSAQFESKKQRLTLMKADAEQRGMGFIHWGFLLLSPGDSPKKNKFSLENLPDDEKWLLDANSELWHEELPLNRTLRRVMRTEKDRNDKWLKWKAVKSWSPKAK